MASRRHGHGDKFSTGLRKREESLDSEMRRLAAERVQAIELVEHALREPLPP